MQGFREFEDDSSNYGINASGGGHSTLNNYLNKLDNGTMSLKNKITARLGGGNKSCLMSPQGGMNSDYRSEFGGIKD